MKNYIPSDYYRQFCEENNIGFSDRERVTILLNNFNISMKEKLSELEKIAAESSDGDLKEAIKNRIKATREFLETVCSSENDCFFIIRDSVPFNDFEAAREYCKTLHNERNYWIDKHRILSSCDTVHSYRDHYCGGVMLDENYEIVDVSLDVFSKITYCFIPFKHPFERGDIVRSCRTGKIGIVETSQEVWNDYLKKNEKNKAYDFSDASLIVECLEDEGFSHKHIQPIYLEKLPLNQNGVPICFDTKNNFNEYLIICASQLMRGEIALDAFISIFLEWREEQIYKNIKSRSWRRT